ncbi:WxL domain-containing protein, partial [Enterococcus faecalis]|uniref:WxL domain-containing protein n=1 Tax=Enterococcus faecalis TaxID=1351 RepID=UPI001FF0DD0D
IIGNPSLNHRYRKGFYSLFKTLQQNPWVYRFGSNEATNKEAVQLFVPGKSVKLAQQYSTKLVWALEDTPANN